MKKLPTLTSIRCLFFVLMLCLPPVSGRSGSGSSFTSNFPSLMIQARQMIGTRLAFAFPPPLNHSEKDEEKRPDLSIFAFLQLALLTTVLFWWRLRLGHWGLR